MLAAIYASIALLELSKHSLSDVIRNVNCRTRGMVILGTQYADVMKIGIHSAVHYLMPK